MYSKLYLSMLIWHSQWYSREAHRQLIAALALTLLMAFNILSIINLLGLGGLHAPLDFIFANKGSIISLFVGLTIFHLTFVVRQAALVKQRRDEVSNLSSKKLAVYYMAISVTLFFSTSMALLALRPRL